MRLDGRALYAAWLGCSQQQDADQTFELISAAGLQSIDWVVVDHYGINAVWENHLLQLFGTRFSSKLW